MRSFILALVVGLVGLSPAWSVEPATRPAAPWPPPQGPLRVIIDTDAACEVDDQHALALALGFPERIQLEGLIAAHFGDSGGSKALDQSLAEIERVLDKAGLKGKVPVKRGADPFTYKDRPPTSAGVDFIIEKALTATPEQPLWLVLLGPATDGVAAIRKEPKIADRLVLFWHGRTQWPVRCWNFNAYNDAKAAQLLFQTPSRLVLFDTGSYLYLSMEESEKRFGKLGPLGKYLVEIRKPRYLSPRKAMFDLGDIAALVDPASTRWERVEAPAVGHDLSYDFTKKHGEIVRIYHIERDRTYDLLEQALRRLQGK